MKDVEICVSSAEKPWSRATAKRLRGLVKGWCESHLRENPAHAAGRFTNYPHFIEVGTKVGWEYSPSGSPEGDEVLLKRNRPLLKAGWINGAVVEINDLSGKAHNAISINIRREGDGAPSRGMVEGWIKDLVQLQPGTVLSLVTYWVYDEEDDHSEHEWFRLGEDSEPEDIVRFLEKLGFFREEVPAVQK